jgi:hypothetical protein
MRGEVICAVAVFELGIGNPAVAIPPAPPAPGPFNDPALAARFTARRTTHYQICEEASDKLADARGAIRTSQAVNGGANDLRRSAHRFSIAESRCLETVRDLMLIQNAAKTAGNAHDEQILQDELNARLLWVYGTAPNALEILEAVTR